MAKKIVLTCIHPIILTIGIGIYLNTIGARAHETAGLNVRTDGATLAACPVESGVPGKRAAFADSQDVGAQALDVNAETPSGASADFFLLDA